MFMAQRLAPSSLPVMIAAADAPVVGVLPVLVEQARVAVQRSMTCVETDDFLRSQIGEQHEDVGGASPLRTSPASRRAPTCIR